MPDLLKNADKTIVLHPEKLTHTNVYISGMIDGWKKHLEVDKVFHSSEFFLHHSHALKIALLPAMEGSPVKPFFLGHVALELILDNLLITSNKITVEDFYHHIEACSEEIIGQFLLYSGLKDPEVFLKFFRHFKNDQYLNSYTEISQIAYALKRICMRIWDQPFTPHQEKTLNRIITDYREMLGEHFMIIFDQIEGKLAA
jgi:hypothetical protein